MQLVVIIQSRSDMWKNRKDEKASFDVLDNSLFKKNNEKLLRLESVYSESLSGIPLKLKLRFKKFKA